MAARSGMNQGRHPFSDVITDRNDAFFCLATLQVSTKTALKDVVTIVTCLCSRNGV